MSPTARTSLALLAGSLVALTALAGCFTSASSPTPNGGGAPPASTVETDALTFLEQARTEAALWSEGAHLVALFGTEGQPLSPVNPPYSWDTSADPLPGNGLALVWTYAFASEAVPEKAFFVSISGSGETLYAQAMKHPGGGFSPYPMHAVVVDEASSDPATCCGAHHTEPEPTPPGIPDLGTPATGSAAAAAAAIAASPDFADFAIVHPVHVVTLGMFAERYGGGNPWGLHKQTAGSHAAGALVASIDGEVLDTWVYPDDWYAEPPCCEPPCCDPPCCEPCAHDASCVPEPWVPEDYAAEHEDRADAFSGRLVQFSVPVDDPYQAVKATIDLTLTNTDLEPVNVRVRDGMWNEIAFEKVSDGAAAFEITEFPAWGPLTVFVEPAVVGNYLVNHDIHALLTVDYEPKPYPHYPNDVDTVTRGAIQGFPGAEYYHSVPLQWGAEHLRITLAPVEGPMTVALGLRIYDEHMNLVDEIPAPAEYDVALPEGYPYTVGVILRGPALLPQEYDLGIQIDYPESGMEEATAEGHVHEVHSEAEHAHGGDHTHEGSHDGSHDDSHEDDGSHDH